MESVLCGTTVVESVRVTMPEVPSGPREGQSFRLVAECTTYALWK